MRFRLHLLVNDDAVLTFPYVGMCEETHRIVLISKEALVIINPEDALFFENDYAVTSRFIDIDLAWIDQLVLAYIGPFDFNIIIRFNKEKHITLTYHSPTNESAKDYDIYEGYPEKRAQKLVADLYPMMEEIKKEALHH